MPRSRASALLLAASLSLGFAPLAPGARPGPFDEPVRPVAPSPAREVALPLAPGASVIDLDASTSGGEVALLVREGAATRLLLWRMGEPEAATAWSAPAGLSPKAVTWHPAARSLFVLAAAGKEQRILRLDLGTPPARERVLYRSTEPLRRIVAGPRPFETISPGGAIERRYRVFFGARVSASAWAIRSVTEEGQLAYQVAGPAETELPMPWAEETGPGSTRTPSALPLGFHPAGHLLIWEGPGGAFQVKPYERNAWGESRPLLGGSLSGGTATPLPNGLGVLHWKPETPGATLVLDGGRTRRGVAEDHRFVSTPSSVPDGRGLVGWTRDAAGRETVRFVPIDLPLADVANAWMFVEGPKDLDLLARSAGLFRPVEGDQLYSLYETELYRCGGLDAPSPTRPYLVTTDVLWEVWAAAFQGLFVLVERRQAVPAFWDFVESARRSLAERAPASRWRRAFEAVATLHGTSRAEPQEAELIRRHAGPATSPALGKSLDYGELKPRGAYASSPPLAEYFSAFRYLSLAVAQAEDVAELSALPAEVREKARAWSRAYAPFAAPPRGPTLFGGEPAAPWASHPSRKPLLFPLSWGFDNEVLDATVFHPDRPGAERIEGPNGPRLLPSSLDVAAALGNRLARTLLEPQVAAYPPLAPALDRLGRRWRDLPRGGAGASLYDRWLDALALQWADAAESLATSPSREVTRVKRLQTGLASWATLRHATVLVNERTAAECGEGGFEEIVMTPPRGAVEADPAGFEAIAGLFDAAAAAFERSAAPSAGSLPSDESPDRATPLREGVLKRLRESARKARGFASMAQRQLAGELLKPSEYEEILEVGHVAEHHFLVFNSLASETLALSTPDPIGKAVDVSGSGPATGGFLHAAVGAPLEWDLVVPFAGRRQVVRGAAYAFHELVSPSLLTDREWRERLPRASRPAWLDPYLSPSPVSCPAKSPF